jgi:hypothetical protein
MEKGLSGNGVTTTGDTSANGSVAPPAESLSKLSLSKGNEDTDGETAEKNDHNNGKESRMDNGNGDNAPVTILHDPKNFNVVHPLAKRWTLWFTKPPTVGMKEDWSELLKKVITFQTVEEFWGVYNNIQKVHNLAQKSDYALFREEVKPEWEDEANKNGGKWAIAIKERSRVDIDEAWLCMVYETLSKVANAKKIADACGNWGDNRAARVIGR